MPDATLAASYPAYGIAHVGRIRRSRRIRQWRGDNCRMRRLPRLIWPSGLHM
ncbi:hypothetical protein [Escherichia coli ISC41]|nr:hypothetical protein [Escherichia coli ISC41]